MSSSSGIGSERTWNQRLKVLMWLGLYRVACRSNRCSAPSCSRDRMELQSKRQGLQCIVVDCNFRHCLYPDGTSRLSTLEAMRHGNWNALNLKAYTRKEVKKEGPNPPCRESQRSCTGGSKQPTLCLVC